MMKVINLFGGPGSGKSTLAAGLFERMKIQGLSVELVTEYAKDMVWERRGNILDDQLLFWPSNTAGCFAFRAKWIMPSPTARCSLA